MSCVPAEVSPDRISFFQGSLSTPDDYDRVSVGAARLVFILPDPNSSDVAEMREQDLNNGVKALALQSHFKEQGVDSDEDSEEELWSKYLCTSITIHGLS
jgi:hypothetical protein